MNKMVPTPGPWQVNTDERFERGKPAIVWGAEGPGHGAVCELEPYYPREFNAADAALIAASPEMYDLIKAMEWAGVTCGDGGPYGGTCPVCEEEKERGHTKGCKLAAVIAKAEGRVV